MKSIGEIMKSGNYLNRPNFAGTGKSLAEHKKQFDKALEEKKIIATEAGYLTQKEIGEAGLVWKDGMWKIPYSGNKKICEKKVVDIYGHTLHEKGEEITVVAQQFLDWKEKRKRQESAGRFEDEALNALVKDFGGTILDT